MKKIIVLSMVLILALSIGIGCKKESNTAVPLGSILMILTIIEQLVELIKNWKKQVADDPAHCNYV